MLFSIVIPTFNRRTLLQQTLASVWRQTYTDFEVIVVDDGSTDGTREDLAALGERVIVAFTNNVGPGAARNAGVARARGVYIAFLDSDDVWFPWTLETMKHFIEIFRSPTILGGKVYEFRNAAELSHVVRQPPGARSFPDFVTAAISPPLIGSNSMVVRRDVLQDIGGFTSLHLNGEDQDLLLRLGTAPGFVDVTSPATIAWRRHADSATATPELSVRGAKFLIAQEQGGRYPGGIEREPERRTLISRIVRPITFDCLRTGRVRAGIELYMATLAWNRSLRKWRYVVGFPLVAFARALWPAPRQR